MLNQLIRQKENVENMINQYSQVQNQPPIQNIINQGTNVEFEAREITGEDVKNILIQRRTLFVDETNKKIYIKEVDGRISKEYDIIVPLDEKDKKIQELENKLLKMEEMLNNVEPTKYDGTDVELEQSVTDVDKCIEPKSKKFLKSISKNEPK